MVTLSLVPFLRLLSLIKLPFPHLCWCAPPPPLSPYALHGTFAFQNQVAMGPSTEVSGSPFWGTLKTPSVRQHPDGSHEDR